MKKYFTRSIIKTVHAIVLTFVISLLFAKTSFAYLSLSETAELIKEDHYRVGVIPQLLLTDGGGSNVGLFFDLPVDKDLNSRFVVGSGTTDFWATASIKWVPYPDYQNQPAIGVRGSFIIAREAKENYYNLQVTPIVSKLVDTRWGKMNPYVGLPLTFIFNNAQNITAMQFAIGTEWVDRSDFQVGAEFDLNLSNTTSAITLHINFPFDGNVGFRQ